MKQRCKRIAQALDDIQTRRRHSALASTYHADSFYEYGETTDDGFVDVTEWPCYHKCPRHTTRLLEMLPASLEQDGGRYWLEVYRAVPNTWGVAYSDPGRSCCALRYAPTLGEALVLLADEVLA